MTFPRKTVLALLAVAVIVAAWIAVLKSASKREPDSTGVIARPEVKASPSAIDEDSRRLARGRWEDRRAKIRAAHAHRAPGDAPGSRAAPSRGCAESDCSADATEDGGDVVFASFIEETTTLTQGCEELIEGMPASVRIEARLIGAPDIGTIVESVDVSGTVEGVDALTECLTEGMYTLELGDAATNFERDAVLMLGLLDEVAGEGWLTPEHVAEIRQQMIDGGLDPAKDSMVAVGADDPSPTP
ncbi:MAG: hypothetical protein IAG13_14990 [Deltaproteobacteria bacterium]|nr:hypothetical protein [Nannocystaceae bacterium]